MQRYRNTVKAFCEIHRADAILCRGVNRRPAVLLSVDALRG